jgi:hypothetical protein
VDHQIGLSQLVRDFSVVEFRNAVLAHAALGKLFNLPTILTTSADTGIFSPCQLFTVELHKNLHFELGPNGALPKEIIDVRIHTPPLLHCEEVYHT